MYFEYEDEEGDQLIIDQAVGDFHAGQLVANFQGGGHTAGGVYLPREQVEKIYNALGVWLYPSQPGPVKLTPQHTRAALSPADVRAVVAEHVAEVVPLYLAGFAAARPCDWCTKRTCRGSDCIWNEGDDDPEPQEVGHPEYEDARPPADFSRVFEPMLKFLEGVARGRAEVEAEEKTPPVAFGAMPCSHCHHRNDLHDGDNGCLFPILGAGLGGVCNCLHADSESASTQPDCARCGHAYDRHTLHSNASCMECGPAACFRYRSTP